MVAGYSDVEDLELVVPGVILEEDMMTVGLVAVDTLEAADRMLDGRAVVAAEAVHHIHIQVAVVVVTWTTQAAPRSLSSL